MGLLRLDEWMTRKTEMKEVVTIRGCRIKLEKITRALGCGHLPGCSDQ